MHAAALDQCIAQPEFGFQVSAEGAGFTWSKNSRQNPLTAWSNDAVSDPPPEALYVRDEESGELWCPTASPIRDPKGHYVARHGQGYSVFEYDSRDIHLELQQFVPCAASFKVSRLELRNDSERTRRLSICAYVEWSLGRCARQMRPSLSPSIALRPARCWRAIPGTASFEAVWLFLICAGSRLNAPRIGSNSSDPIVPSRHRRR